MYTHKHAYNLYMQAGRNRKIELVRVSLYTILFHCKALLWESIILLLPPPPLAKPTLLQYHCTAIAQYTPPRRHPSCMPYTIQYW